MSKAETDEQEANTTMTTLGQGLARDCPVRTSDYFRKADDPLLAKTDADAYKDIQAADDPTGELL